MPTAALKQIKGYTGYMKRSSLWAWENMMANQTYIGASRVAISVYGELRSGPARSPRRLYSIRWVTSRAGSDIKAKGTITLRFNRRL